MKNQILSFDLASRKRIRNLHSLKKKKTLSYIVQEMIPLIFTFGGGNERKSHQSESFHKDHCLKHRCGKKTKSFQY